MFLKINMIGQQKTALFDCEWLYTQFINVFFDQENKGKETKEKGKRLQGIMINSDMFAIRL